MMKPPAGATERARDSARTGPTTGGPTRTQKNFHRDGSDFPLRAGRKQPKLIVGKGL